MALKFCLFLADGVGECSSRQGGDRMQKLMIVAALVFVLVVGFAAGWQVREAQPVGHAQSEDSPIRGMDYRDGAWYTK